MRLFSGLLVSTLALGTIVTTGCAEHRSRTYDPYYGSSYRGYGGEDPYYRQWLAERRYNYVEYNQLNRERQREYWEWRNQNNARFRQDQRYRASAIGTISASQETIMTPMTAGAGAMLKPAMGTEIATRQTGIATERGRAITIRIEITTGIGTVANSARGSSLAMTSAPKTSVPRRIAGRPAALPQNCLTTEGGSRTTLSLRPHHFSNFTGCANISFIYNYLAKSRNLNGASSSNTFARIVGHNSYYQGRTNF